MAIQFMLRCLELVLWKVTLDESSAEEEYSVSKHCEEFGVTTDFYR